MFTVGRAGELANVHPQTLRQYDRLGLVVPQRTDGGARRYSLRDIARLAKAQQLSQEEGINLAGIARILSLRRTASCAARSSVCASRPVPACSQPIQTATLWEIERSRRARMWRRQIQVNARQLPSRESLESARSQADAPDNTQWRCRTRKRGVSGGANPLQIPFPGQSCFGELTDFRKKY